MSDQVAKPSPAPATNGAPNHTATDQLMTDELDLHDEAAETADQTLSDLKELAAESISRRAARIRSEIYSMIEACSLLGSINWNALRGGGVKNPETIDHALKMHHFACAAEAVGYTAIE